MKPNLLIVDDEEHTREGLELALEDRLRYFLPQVPKKPSMLWTLKDLRLF